MFGLFYIGIGIAERIVYGIKSTMHDATARKDDWGNYYDFEGVYRDGKTDRPLIFERNKDGDRVFSTYEFKKIPFQGYRYNKWEVRNLDEEERQKTIDKMKSDPNNKERFLQIGFDEHLADKVQGRRYRDIYTEKTYVKHKFNRTTYRHDEKEVFKIYEITGEFYIDVANPYNIAMPVNKTKCRVTKRHRNGSDNPIYIYETDETVDDFIKYFNALSIDEKKNIDHAMIFTRA